MWSTPTPCCRRNLAHDLPKSLSGSRVTNSTGTPKLASDAATLASAPPKDALNDCACSNLACPGGDRRIMISPNVTTLLSMATLPVSASPVAAMYAEAFLLCRQAHVQRRRAIRWSGGASEEAFAPTSSRYAAGSHHF